MSSLRTETISVQNLGLLEYESAWQLQREIQAGVIAGLTPNTLLLLEHPPVFTAGRRTSELDRPTDGTPVINVDRGGKITWHGPGQIVGYPIVKLKNGNDVVGFVREIENALIEVCKEFGVNAERYCERTGVWIRDAKGDRKLAAIGIRVAKGVTMHGFALNVNPDLSWFTRIIPCGIPDVEVTSLSVELGRNISIVEILDSVTRNITSALGKVAE
ncbi:MAG: lipoyl(octanoyl) transferase LipB [Actinobacteria bacterium]|jgi:lipoyl(octanoyl) transferase|uniref:lipoyl(octanoyl) transferase n=1 Tax=freshwater metagenome TaxID=449393 RepID=A0A6J6T3M0_9ZZZZ|nr:lipoyl(octanoyl) transferase LipB [Actinomycetota bacterium]MSZ00097.1 lipoyl(octanoyl) transferase LipB [Actinomycetota bacterium]MSZ61959.1 lipoyl(octanoyl) transferase LipB [Actinomycetota bacterium]MTA23724.1 lipoyl(octanoyl) transferase LipB [Actinomycetota bacterium]